MVDNFDWAHDLLAVFDFNDPELRSAVAAAGIDPNAKASSQCQQEQLTEEFQQKLQLNGSAAEAGLDAGIAHYIKRESSFASTTDLSSAVSNLTAVAERKRIAAYKVLAQELCDDWRTFGRALQIREGTMDNIELEFPTELPSRVYRLLQLFEEDDSHDHRQNALIICRALDVCRRKNLRHKVENIMYL